MSGNADREDADNDISVNLGMNPFDIPIDETVSESLIEGRRSGKMITCRTCHTLLEPWQLECHSCGTKVSDVELPNIESALPVQEELEQSYQDWYSRGLAALTNEQYGEAQSCFIYALNRGKALPNATVRETILRKELAKAYAKQEKRREASTQYSLLANDAKAQAGSPVLGAVSKSEPGSEGSVSATSADSARSGDSQLRTGEENPGAMARTMSATTTDIFGVFDSFPESHSKVRAPSAEERRLVPLYCSSCGRLLLESETYGYRNGKLSNINCFCGNDAPPVVRLNESHMRALHGAPRMRTAREAYIQAAAAEFPHGKNRNKAILLAVFLGAFGAHKFYLGEKYACYLYAALCWTGLSIIVSLVDAFLLSQMSRVTFNMKFNIEQVIENLPPEPPLPDRSPREEIFAMEVTRDPEDFEDEYT